MLYVVQGRVMMRMLMGMMILFIIECVMMTVLMGMMILFVIECVMMTMLMGMMILLVIECMVMSMLMMIVMMVVRMLMMVMMILALLFLAAYGHAHMRAGDPALYGGFLLILHPGDPQRIQLLHKPFRIRHEFQKCRRQHVSRGSHSTVNV